MSGGLFLLVMVDILGWVVVVFGAAVGPRLCELFGDRGRERAAAVCCLWYREVKPFYLPAAAFHFVMVFLLDLGHATWFDRLISVLALVLWPAVRSRSWHDHDDDRWKRRRKKAAEAIRRHGARLIVVPAGSQA